ncbi:unnamed protein product [Coregonus sp. 'balchen']|nr:unnamed protein product [Coregonus sp. 'balchen']
MSTTWGSSATEDMDRHVRMRGLLLSLGCFSTLSTPTSSSYAIIQCETNKDSGKCTKPPCFSGVARRFTKIQEIRSREKNVMLLDAGDQFQGTVWFNVYKGAEAAHFMNRLGYDAMVFDVDSKKVGVVGYTSKETPALSQTGPNLVFEDEIDALQPQVDKLITLGVNMIIALGHSGFVTDKEIARRVKGVDVVIGGHSNTFLYTGEQPSSEVPAGPYPVIVRSDDGRDVPVVQAFAFGKYLGYLKVTFDETGNVLHILAEVNEWKKALANYSSQYVGETLVYLNGTFEECRFRECNLGNLICDAMVHHNIKYADELQWNHVSSCILQGGAIRSSIDERSRNGSITMEDLIAVLPFGGTYDLVQLKGSTLRKAFEHSVRRYGGNTGEFLQVSGFHVEYDMSRPHGERARSISVLCTDCRVPVYEPLDDSRLYKVVMPSYLVEGGDGFSMIKEENLAHNSGDMDISVVASYIAERKKVHPAVEGRIKISNSASGGPGHMALLIMLGLVMALSGRL